LSIYQSALIQEMAWRHGDKPFLEAMLTLTYDANLLLSLNGLMFDFWPAWKK